MRVAITGGTGMIGSALASSYLAEGHEVQVLTRGGAMVPVGARRVAWNGRSAGEWWRDVEGCDVFVNLAGSGIGEGRWTEARKRLILRSRVDSGAAISDAIARMARRPAVLVQASGVGRYGERGEDILSEDQPPGDDFLSGVAVAWEASSAAVEGLGVRRVLARTGVVLAQGEGALPRMARPVRWFVGGPLGTGRQWLSWIHIADQVAALRFLAADERAVGPFNLVAPQPVRQRDFALALARALHRPALVPTPAIALRALLGEMADLLLRSQRAVPDNLLRLGFSFRFPTLDAALADIYG
jgi:uncharacterized protein (TIGR01777 family)